jgi:GNAT superfamily N-acetyltransferase
LLTKPEPARLGKPTNGDALKEIESLYESRGIPVEIDLCPFAEEATLELLKRREYAVNAFSSTFVHTSLHLCQGRDEESDIHIRDLSPDEEGRFIEWSQTGFAAHTVPRPADLLRLLAISALRRTDTQIKVAEIDGNVAGTAAVSIIGVEGTRAAHLFLASTLPEFRGRGVQGALLQARLDVARRAGAMLATVTARPTNSSARNTERAGFRSAFTKATFSRQPR